MYAVRTCSGYRGWLQGGDVKIRLLAQRLHGLDWKMIGTQCEFTSDKRYSRTFVPTARQWPRGNSGSILVWRKLQVGELRGWKH
jgi:hypothetical protein